MLEKRLEPSALEWFKKCVSEIGDEVPPGRFAVWFSSASRQARDRDALAPDEGERKAAEKAVEGWNPERWGLLEAVRVGLMLARTDLDDERGSLLVEDLFQYADEGEQRALYRSLALLPEPERYVWRAGEGCRTNMTNVFEAVVLDTPFPARWFDDGSFRQAALKAVFVGVPLWRMWGLDQRLDEELCRMALDLVDERRSAHRTVQPDLWLCLGAFGGERARAALEVELEVTNTHRAGRQAAAVALARAGASDRLQELAATEQDEQVLATMRAALDGATTQAAFAAFQP